MSATTDVPFAAAEDRHAGYQKGRLFFVSSLALVTAGVASSLRANTAGDLQRLFFDPIDKAHSAAMIAGVLGVPFLGFALTIALSSPLLDIIGMRFFLPLSGLLLTLGSAVMVFAEQISGGGAGIERTLWAGALIAGIGWGMVESVVNPLIATLYPDEKTAKLNALHAWWPAGLVIGGLLGVFLTGTLNWQGKLALVALPGIAVVLLSLGVEYPPTERKAAGVTTGEMFRELANPIFLVLFLAMFLTAASELAPGQWVDLALTRTVHMPGILLLVYVSGLMFVMRFFAGPLVHRLSPIGLLWVSCLLAAIGLVMLSVADSPITGLVAATVWGTGVCYMWPTMLATASERFPRGGAVLMGLMGTAGMLSIQFVLPMMGRVFDSKKVEFAGGPAAFAALPAGPELERVLGMAAQVSFRYVAVLPAVLLLVFGAIWMYDRSKGGFKATRLS